eukprot:TRINITY_DN3426_c0_g3_i3.p1 TRINITY_DN3426_c0_g3~~TRINITY_DN3426_c0_g3_i3.p1  ORF type:complete len:233 (-),score=31.59 TRINITY_DN3426_c0_g3_i3:96-794(-)
MMKRFPGTYLWLGTTFIAWASVARTSGIAFSQSTPSDTAAAAWKVHPRVWASMRYNTPSTIPWCAPEARPGMDRQSSGIGTPSGPTAYTLTLTLTPSPLPSPSPPAECVRDRAEPGALAVVAHQDARDHVQRHGPRVDCDELVVALAFPGGVVTGVNHRPPARPRVVEVRHIHDLAVRVEADTRPVQVRPRVLAHVPPCLLYTSDAADEEDSVDLGGRRIIKKKKKEGEKWE